MRYFSSGMRQSYERMHPSMCTTGMLSCAAAMAPVVVFVSPRNTAAAGRIFVEHRKQPRDDRRDDLGVGRAAAPEIDLRRRDVELAEENRLEIVGVVLPRPDEHHLHVGVLAQLVDHERRADDVRPDPENEC